MFLQRVQPRIARSIVGLLVAGFVQVGISAPAANAAPLAAPTITSSSVTSTTLTVNLQTSGFSASSWRYIVTRRVVSGCANSGGDTAVRTTSSLDASITITGLTEGCYYTVKVAGYNGAIGSYAAVDKLVNGYFNGLKGYHKEETTTYEGFTRVPFTSGTCSTEAITSVYKNWDSGGPAGCSNQNFTSYFVGYLKAPHTGTVTFRSANDDGLKLNIQGQQVFFSSSASASGSIAMVKDEIYRIEIWFHEVGGGAAFFLDWEYGTQARIQVPDSSLASDPSVFFGTCPIGLDARCPAGSAYEIKRATNTNMDGHYWILIDGTPTLVFCVMNSSQGGGGWMLAMRGKNSSSEFKYDSSYWTNTTLTSNSSYPERFSASDTIDTYRNTDAKYAPFASTVGNQVMVLYPEVTDKGGGAFASSNLSGVNSVAYGFAWYETFTSGKKWKAYNASAADGYPAGWGGDSWNIAHTNGPSSVPNCVDSPSTLTYLFTNASRCAFRQVQSNYNSSESPYSAVGDNVFFSQTDIRFFGINYGNSSTSFYSKSRIGFGWNENYGGNEASNDGNGGIGMASSASTSIAAGTYNGCCSTDNHLNPGQAGLSGGNGTTKQLGFELYVRNSTEISVAGRNYLKITQGRTASYTAGAGYYLSNHTGTTTYRLSAIRDGFTIDPSTGVVSATEALPIGTYSTTITVGDANNASGTRTFTIQVVADSGNVDQSVTFNGTSQYLKTGGTIGLWGNFTYEAWVRPREDCTETNIYRRVISTSNFHISCGNGYWYVGITDNSSVFTRTKLAQRVIYEEWAHLAVVRSGTTVTVYYNNVQMRVLVGSSWENSFTVSSIKNDYSAISVGGTGTADEYFPGRIDEVKIWDSARSLSDIWTKSHEAEDLGSTNLLMYWDFNETTDSLTSRSQRADANFNFTEYNAPFRAHIASLNSSGPYYYLSFPRSIITKNGGFQMYESVTALSALVLGGGGGGGGGYQGGGGGAGGFKEITLNVDELSFYPIKVGVGGVGATNPLGPSNGETSTAFGVSAAGGGSGMAEFNVNSVNTQYPAGSGGSGGGGAHGTIRNGGSGIAGQGFAGAYGVDLYPTCSHLGGGGGGGAGGTGFSAICNDSNVSGSSHGGYGGVGLNSSIANFYASVKGYSALAAGGGGSLRLATTSTQRGLGGSTSAGDSGYVSGAAIAATGGATNARPTSGSGGGAGLSTDGATGYGGAGGSGVVVFRYIVAKKPTFTKPTNAYLNVGMTETFTTNVAQDSETAQLTRTFRWESSTSGSNGSFSLIKEGTGAANASFSWVPPDTSTSGSSFVYRVIVTDSDTAGLFIVDTSTPVFATINGALKLTSKSSLSKTVNISKSETFTVSSGTPTYRYSLTTTSGNFTLDTTTVGSPVIKFADTATVGTYFETFTVTDSVSAVITVPLTITVNPPPSFSANSAQVDSATVLYLDAGNQASYPGSGSSWKDISGRGLTASFPPLSMPAQNAVTSLTCTTPQYSQSNLGVLDFNGTDTCGYLPNLGFLPTYTYEVWIKRTGSNMGPFSGIIASPWTGTNGAQINLSLHWRNGTDIQAGIFNGTGGWTASTPLLFVADQTWTHVVVTLDSNLLTITLNGETDFTQEASVSISWDSTKNNGGILIGKRYDQSGYFFKGSIASIRVYNRVLTEEEIQQNYNATKGRFLNTQNKVNPTGKYGLTTNETYTVTAGSETVTATFTANAMAGIIWDTSTVRSMKVQLQDTLTPGTYLDTITVTDIYGSSTRIRLTFTISKADTITVYVDTPTALSYTGSTAAFSPAIRVNGLVLSDTGTATSVAYKPGGTTCATGGTCSVGDIGPGGGIVFITPATANSNGKYFEAAPANWTGSDDLASVAKFCEGVTNQDSISRGASNYGIGWGETNTGLFDWRCNGGAVNKVDTYAGGGYTDWFLPSSNELIELANVRTQAGLLQLGSSWTSGTQGYWGSTEADASTMQTLVSVNGAWNIGSTSKSDATHLMVRPVRMFSPCWAVDTCTALSSSSKPTDAGVYVITPSALTLSSGSLSNYESVEYVSTSVTINQINQSALTLSTYSLFFPDSMTVGTSGGSGTGALNFAVTGSSGPTCVFDWRKLGASAAGNCTIQVTKTADRNYLSTSASATVYFALFIPYVPLPEPTPGPGIGLQGVTAFAIDPTVAPAFTGMSASSGAVGSSLQITGIGFSFVDPNRVTVKFWRGVTAQITSIPNDNTINVTVPAGATNGRILIITPNGMVGTTTFTVTP